jgi:hypothetical protein
MTFSLPAQHRHRPCNSEREAFGQAVCILLDIKPSRTKDEAGQAVVDFWKLSVALMNERDFLGRLRGYDKDAIPPRVIEARPGPCRAPLPSAQMRVQFKDPQQARGQT